jgi:hypothetical protein
MSEKSKQTLLCRNCQNPVTETDEFCARCGRLMIVNISCRHHPERSAGGVCVVCQTPLCGECERRVNNVFLCAKHSGYEIHQGMARVFGIDDFAQADYVRGCLEQAELHPLLYSRKARAVSVGGQDRSLCGDAGDCSGHIREFKVMVPCPELVKAEQVLRALELAE